MVWWRRNQRDAGNSVTRLGNNLVHFKARQLSALTRLCTLSHLYLYLLGIYQVFGRHAKSSRCYLLRLARQRDTVHLSMVTSIVLTTLTGITPCS